MLIGMGIGAGIVRGVRGSSSVDRSILNVPFSGSDGATAATDFSPHAHALTFVGNAQITGNALALDGTGDWVSVPNNALFNFGSGVAFSIYAQVYLASVPVDAVATITGNWLTTGNQRAWWLRVDNATTAPTLTFVISPDGLSSSLTTLTGGSVSYNTFHDVAVTRDAIGLVSLFLDGVVVASASYPGAIFSGSGAIGIGARDAGGGVGSGYWTGTIDDVQFIKGVAIPP